MRIKVTWNLVIEFNLRVRLEEELWQTDRMASDQHEYLVERGIEQVL